MSEAETPAPSPESDAPSVSPEPAAGKAGHPPPFVPAAPPPAPSRGPGSSPEPKQGDAGRIVGGTVQKVTADEVELTLDDGRPAVINRRNFDANDVDPTTIISEGDRVEGAILARDDPRKRVVLSRTWAHKMQTWERLAASAESAEVLTGKVTGTSKRGVVIDVGVRGFMPSSHLEIEPPKDLSPYVGQVIEFKILEIDPAKERLVLSRRSLLMKEQRKVIHDLLAGLVIGETRAGTVTSLADYGAFVDLGGVSGLVHLSELSWARIRHPGDLVNVGDEVEVKVLDVRVKRKRVSLSMRQLAPDPLEAVPVGEVIEGPVSRLVDFGAFVDVGGAEGLVHLSELAEYRVFAPEEVVTPGEVVRVKVLSVDRKRRRIELSIRQAVYG